MLSQKTAEAHLLMVWDGTEVADVFEANWYVNFDGPTKLCPGDQLLFRHILPRVWLGSSKPRSSHRFVDHLRVFYEKCRQLSPETSSMY